MSTKETGLEVDLGNLGSPEVETTGIIFGLAAGIAVLLRFSAKQASKNALGWDDWWIAIGLVFYWIEVILEICAVEIIRSNPLRVSKYFELQYAAAAFYYPGAAFTKLSILCLYRRIFAVQDFRIASSVVISICALWAVSCGIVQIFLCTPVQKLWIATLEGNCINYGHFFLSSISLEVALDALILSLPIRWIIGLLRLSTTRKIQVTSIFLLGGFVVITNIVRLIKSYDPVTNSDIVWEDLLWFNIHAGTAIVCACLPTYKPLIRKVSTVISQRSQSSRTKSAQLKATPATSAATESADKRSHYNKMNDFGNDSAAHLAKSSKQAPWEQDVQLEPVDHKNYKEMV
ncbi:hypothetical protein ACLMJK_009378 [Lecanora helva]